MLRQSGQMQSVSQHIHSFWSGNITQNQPVDRETELQFK